MYRSAPPRRCGHAGSDRPGPVGVAEGLAARWRSRDPWPARRVPWPACAGWLAGVGRRSDRKSTRLNSSHANISYAVFCLKKKKQTQTDKQYKKNKKKTIQQHTQKYMK